MGDLIFRRDRDSLGRGQTKRQAWHAHAPTQTGSRGLGRTNGSVLGGDRSGKEGEVTVEMSAFPSQVDQEGETGTKPFVTEATFN